MFEKPNYYSILPADVRYSKDLTYFEKILYSEITALSNAQGYCWASNNYFAELYQVTKLTISRSINNIEKLGFIKIEIEQEKGNLRKLFLTPIIKNDNTPIIKNDNTPIIKNDKYNNTRTNNTRFNKTSVKKVGIVPHWYGDYLKQCLSKNTTKVVRSEENPFN